MEDDAALESVAGPDVVAGQTARLDIAQAEAELDSALAVTRDAARADLADAESQVVAGSATIAGIASTLLDEAITPVQKRIAKLQGDTATTLTQAYQQLFSAGASPAIAGPDVAADIARNDYVSSAVEQLLSPFLPSDVDCVKSPNADVCAVNSAPPAIEFDPFAPAPTPAPTPAGPVVAEPVVAEPIAEPIPPYTAPTDPFSPAACPAPVIDVPACPIPAVVLVDRETGTITSVPGAYQSGNVPTPEPAPMPRPVGPEPAPMPRPVVPPAAPREPNRPQFQNPYEPIRIGIDPPPNDWSRPEACARIAFETNTNPGGGRGARSIDAAIQPITSVLDGTALSLFSGLLGGLGLDSFAGVSPFSNLGTWTSTLTGQIQNNAPPGAGAVIGTSLAALAGLGWGERITCAPLTYFGQGYKYDMQYADPQFLPSQAEVNAAYLAFTIDTPLWECLTRANGNHVWGQRAVVQAQRTRPGVGDLIGLWRRGLMDDRALSDAARAQGVLEDTELDQLKAVSEFVPPYSDIVRMMVRDSADDTAVEFGQFDKGFTDKFVGPLREWARANGISADVFKYLWRAHWELPSATQLYEMLRRLRPGKVPDGLAVTPETVRRTLEQNDLAPGFVERLMAVSYNTITRTDLLQWFVNGSITEDELVERLQDTGYSIDDAKRIVEGWRTEKANRVQNRALLWTRKNISKHYIDGNIDRDTAKRMLGKSIPSPKDCDDILDDADLMRSAERRRKCIRAVRRQMFTGKWTEIETRRELVRLGLDAAVAATIAEGWTCEIASAAKEPTVKMLREWLVNGVIDTNDFYHRLLNLRYTREDAQRILDTAVLIEQKRLSELAAKAAKEQEARREKAAKELARQREKAAKAAQQQQRRKPGDQSP